MGSVSLPRHLWVRIAQFVRCTVCDEGKVVLGEFEPGQQECPAFPTGFRCLTCHLIVHDLGSPTASGTPGGRARVGRPSSGGAGASEGCASFWSVLTRLAQLSDAPCASQPRARWWRLWVLRAALEVLAGGGEAAWLPIAVLRNHLPDTGCLRSRSLGWQPVPRVDSGYGSAPGTGCPLATVPLGGGAGQHPRPFGCR